MRNKLAWQIPKAIFPKFIKFVYSSLDNQIPSYVAPKTRSHVGPGVSLADENPLYEPTGSYGTAKGIP